MEKKKRVRRSDRFLRIKNKYEPVYRAPLFLKNTVGISCVSESGIFQIKESYSKVYELQRDMNLQDMQDISKKLRGAGVDYGFLFEGKREEGYLLVHIKRKGMSEAIEGFGELEQEIGLLGIDAEQRLRYYSNFLSGLFGSDDRPHSFLLEARVWKTSARMKSLMAEEGYMKAEEGTFEIVAVRRFPEHLNEQAFRKLRMQECVVAVYMETLPVPDSAVRDMLYSNYLGLEGVLPRMKRSNPVLYDVLNREQDEDTGSFVEGLAYFLLKTVDSEKMTLAQADFFSLAKESGILLEKVPVADIRQPGEMKREIALFGMSGNRPERYKRILPCTEADKMVAGRSSVGEQEKHTYDIEEMRALFFHEKGGISGEVRETEEKGGTAG